MNLRGLFGSRGERVAMRYLRRRKYRILTKNYRCPTGEVDIICSDGDCLVFVEVKTRTSADAGEPEEAINPGKWRRIERTARHYVTRYSLQHRPARFDVVSVVWPKNGAPIIEHFEDAFHPTRG